MSELKQTALHDAHTAAGARMIGFAGWSMPLSYMSQIEEHHTVRRAAGIFDVSHMTIVDLSGDRSRDYLRRMLANDVAKLDARGGEGFCPALYSCLLDEAGGILDDLIAYRLDERSFRLVVNAATREKDLAWLERYAEAYGVELRERDDLAMVAVQGPDARAAVAAAISEGRVATDLKPFSALSLGESLVARTGYTGEDGVEIMMPASEVSSLWDELLSLDVRPCGLGARDTLRLEAGLNLYGLDMDESDTPLECGLGWTVALTDERAFNGRETLESRLAEGVEEKQVGLILDARGVLRAGYQVMTDAGDGVVTSGTFSPTLERSIALARVPAGAGENCEVVIRGRAQPARSVKPPFVRNGEIKVSLTADE